MPDFVMKLVTPSLTKRFRTFLKFIETEGKKMLTIIKKSSIKNVRQGDNYSTSPLGTCNCFFFVIPLLQGPLKACN